MRGHNTLVIIAIALSITTCSANDRGNVKFAKKNRADMIFIPAATYTMGPSDPNWQAGNTTPPHQVTLNSFYISKYNVSYGAYDTYTKITGRPLLDPVAHKYHIFYRSSKHPVNNITWYQANNYCHWLQKSTGLPYDLPTEAQWEYVARNLGKKNWRFATNDGKQELGKNFPDFNQFRTQKGNDAGALSPLPIASIPCTPMGVCGLNGEVNQWMKDWYDNNYYAHSPINDPPGPKTGTKKSMRGGGLMYDSPRYAHNFTRDDENPNKKISGFRCVINSSIIPSKLGVYAEGNKYHS